MINPRNSLLVRRVQPSYALPTYGPNTSERIKVRRIEIPGNGQVVDPALGQVRGAVWKDTRLEAYAVPQGSLGTARIAGGHLAVARKSPWIASIKGRPLADIELRRHEIFRFTHYVPVQSAEAARLRY